MQGSEKQVQWAERIKTNVDRQVQILSEAFTHELQVSERVKEGKYDSYVERWYLGLVPAMQQDTAQFYLDNFGELAGKQETDGESLYLVYQYIISTEFGVHMPSKYNYELTLAYNNVQPDENLRIEILKPF
ncbi:hypothetical protein [Listeria booriae]|uniref:hypothetical protein n=1 Tax=Listeria booriae TaxID=1552123 RepID=UPI001627093F|nr:hypothetical protein [Listeria booriae]MBC2164692.1 hypothetical protein [Listeria booriae]